MPFTDTAKRLESEMAEFSKRLSPEAGVYWQRHQPRYRYLMDLLENLRASHAFHKILDVGMGFQTLLISKLFPESRVDCLGVYEDDRYRPANDFTFYAMDLNDVAIGERPPTAASGPFDLIVFMEVLEHLYTPPETVLRFLASILRDGGVIIITTPNAAWLKNRIKMFFGKNPFEMLKNDRKNMGHVREYTQPELERSLAAAGLKKLFVERRGLYHFDNIKDNVYSRMADLAHPSLRRTLVAVYQKEPQQA